VTQDQSDAISYLRSRARKIGITFIFEDDRMLQALDEYIEQALGQNVHYASYLSAADYMWQEMKPKLLEKRTAELRRANAHLN
jgi:hypothetical protein